MVLLRRGGAAPLQLGEDLREEGRLTVDPEHLLAEQVHDEEATVPELFPSTIHQERFQRVGYLTAHVRVGQVEAGEEHRLQLALFGDLVVDQLPEK